MSSNNNSKAGEYTAVETSDIEATSASLVPQVAVEAKKLSVQVTAPSDLQQGFALNVQVDGKAAVVIVPRGGVSAGESFVGPVEFINPHDASTATRGVDGIPVGEWRTGFCDCCTHGFFHPLWIMTWCYAALPLAQVQTRLNLNLWAEEKSTSNTTNQNNRGPSTFRWAMIIFCVWMACVRGLQALYKALAPNVPTMTMKEVVQYPVNHVNQSVLSLGTVETIFDVFVVAFLLGSACYYRCFLDQPTSFRFLLGTLFLVTIGMDSIGFVVGFVAGFEDGMDQSQHPSTTPEIDYVTVPGAARFVAMVHQGLLWAMRLFIIIVGTKTRMHVRRKYAIPGDDCTDCCCMVCCPCCTVIQLSNHTANYHETPMDYGAEDGLQDPNNSSSSQFKDHPPPMAVAMPVISSVV